MVMATRVSVAHQGTDNLMRLLKRPGALVGRE
jgi:hypothetical protein